VRRSRSALVLLALLLGAFAARRAEAHMVPVGVGTQTWIEVRPRTIEVRFNLGFSSNIGLGESLGADTNHDKRISNDEERAYLEQLGKRVLPLLRLTLDGKPLELRLIRSQGVGMVGPIDQNLGFDTIFDLEAAVSIGPGPHELTYYDGTYEKQVSQQILYLVTERADDFKDFAPDQKPGGPPPQEADGATIFQGRDVELGFELTSRALERDRAEALIEPWVAGLQATADALATSVARSAESDLAALPLGEVRLGVSQVSLLKTRRRGFAVSAPLNADRARDAGSPGGFGSLTTLDSDEEKKMKMKVREPFTLLAVFIFLIWGAGHATTPGHGKTMVAAYLLGTKGRIWDAARLGAIVTFTHTFVLYTFGLGLVFLANWLGLTASGQDAVFRRGVFLLKLLSGIGLFFFGLGLAWRRKAALAHGHHAHGHSHEHVHVAPAPAVLAAPSTGKRLALVAAAPIEAENGNGPDADARDGHTHSHDGHTHSHDGHAHSHEGISEDEHAALHAREASSEITSFRDLLALGISGGLVPCPAGILLIISSIALQQSTLKTFIYLNAFSVGLGSVLVAIAMTMVLSRSFLVRSATPKQHGLLDWLPMASAAVVACIGLGIAYDACDPSFARARERLASAFASAPAKPAR
jgi:ABC-type nickel/cobalt efflux system permease component RcnA